MPIQQQALLPLIKRQVPEGKDYRIIIPENVEHIIRKFCAKAPDNEWSGTLFYEFEGDFDSDSFKIICRDFFLMDLGSSAYTEFIEDGTAIDYMVQHPELLSCQMGLTHSHDRMPTFFSNTDISTLQKEGTDRNNFVSLIVNNDGTYSAAITRKVEYIEKHDIEITGKYPLFGTRRIYELPPVHSKDEKKKTVVEWFDLVVEKHSVHFQPDEYDMRFNEIAAKRINKQSSRYSYSDMSGIKKQQPWAGGGFIGREDDEIKYADDYDDVPKSIVPSVIKPAEKTLCEIKEPTLFNNNPFIDDVFDDEFVQEALTMPSLIYKLEQLMLEILTGCPIISNWVKPGEINNSLFEKILDSFNKAGYTEDVYHSFVYSALTDRFVTIEPEEYFPKYALEEGVSAYMLENVITVKLINLMNKLSSSKLRSAALEALIEFYSL